MAGFITFTKIEYPQYHSERRGDRRYTVRFLETFVNVYCLGFAGLDRGQGALRASANIDTILQQRHELWPNLEKIVKASLAHEKQLLKAIPMCQRSCRLNISEDNHAPLFTGT
ncbi:LemA family protein [Marinobacter flavimaris]|uniref:LemA family protein n=1 Tax=Marinobacter flavimaris TaxID=262076 RepID=UPI00386B5281